LLPHLEISRAPVRRGRIYDTYIGDASRKRMGDRAWSRRVRDVLIGLRPVFEWDRLYIGGGNGARIEQRDLLAVGGAILVVPNSAGIIGGVKAWDLQMDQLRQPMSAAGRPNPGPLDGAEKGSTTRRKAGAKKKRKPATGQDAGS